MYYKKYMKKLLKELGYDNKRTISDVQFDTC